MAKKNLLPIILIGGAAAVFLLMRKKASAKSIDQEAEITDITDETGKPAAFETADDTKGGENFLSTLVPAVKTAAVKAGKKALAKYKAKRAAKKAAFPKNVPLMQPVVVRAKAGKKRRKKTAVRGFDALPVLY